jgi:hypothetical protein
MPVSSLFKQGLHSTAGHPEKPPVQPARRHRPHHLRYLQPRALGRKVSDEFAVPLCRSHHRAVHRAGDEQAWWTAAGIDPAKVARQLWRQTRLDDPQHRDQACRCTREDSIDCFGL